MIIENEKLFIEKFKESDISEWSKIESDLRVRHFVDGKKQTYKQSEEYIKKNIYPMILMDLVDMLFV